MAEASSNQDAGTPGADGADVRSPSPLAILMARPGAACPHCRYSLSGLGKHGDVPERCPECGGGLEAGLVGSSGPRRLRMLMALMFGWLAFAGTMNGSRWAVIVHDYLDQQAAMARASGVRSNSIMVLSSRVLAPGMGGGVPREWWLEVGGWGLLGLVGLFGVVAALLLKAGNRRGEKRLMLLLLLGFLGYWGYHGIQFGLEMVSRFG